MIDTAERVLPLQGGRNFRDLGGYPAADGRKVRWGQLFRSGSMAYLTAEDYDRLARLGIASVCDFRNTTERKYEPTLWPEASTPRMFARDYDTHTRDLTRAGLTGATARDLMLELYADLPYRHVDSYRAMFAELLAGHVPLLFNCSAGKDRTGVAAALLLTALGVPREHVVADYAMTETILDFDAIVRQTGTGKVAVGFERIARLAPEVRTAIMRSEPDYLAAAFTELEAKEGSIEGYLDRQLGVGAGEIETLRDVLLA